MCHCAQLSVYMYIPVFLEQDISVLASRCTLTRVQMYVSQLIAFLCTYSLCLLLPTTRATERALEVERGRVKAGQGSTAACTCLMAPPLWPWLDQASPSETCWQASVRREASLYLTLKSTWWAMSRYEHDLAPTLTSFLINSSSFPNLLATPNSNSFPISIPSLLYSDPMSKSPCILGPTPHSSSDTHSYSSKTLLTHKPTP